MGYKEVQSNQAALFDLSEVESGKIQRIAVPLQSRDLNHQTGLPSLRDKLIGEDSGLQPEIYTQDKFELSDNRPPTLVEDIVGYTAWQYGCSRKKAERIVAEQRKEQQEADWYDK
ncbi:MAG: hypothetical protein ACOX6V_01195 [Patescibacteria group bacterium]|jgi:hypothetical protein